MAMDETGDYPTMDSQDTTEGEEAPETAKDEGKETALLSKEFFGGKMPELGKTCEIKPVHIYEDEVEVEYVPHESKKDMTDEEDAFSPARMKALGVNED